MNRQETGFLLIIIIAYIICSFIFNLPKSINIIFLALLTIVLLGSVILKLKEKVEYEKIDKIADASLIIIFIISVISFISEIHFNKPFLDSGIFMTLFVIILFAKWFFGKN